MNDGNLIPTFWFDRAEAKWNSKFFTYKSYVLKINFCFSRNNLQECLSS